MSGTRRLTRNSIINLVGQGIPLVVAVFAVPPLVHGLGVERFGILTLAWTAIGYFSLFDLGLGRALTWRASTAIGGGRLDDLPVITITALRAMALLGVVGGGVLALAGAFLVDRGLELTDPLRGEAITSLYLLCASLPFVLATAGIRGIFEAHQDFGAATMVRLPYAVFNFVAPLAVLPFSRSLVPIVSLLVMGRVATCLAHWIVARRRYPFLAQRMPARREIVLPLLEAGGWMTVSNLISPLMVNFDRFVVGGMFSVAAVAYYATPYDMVMKLLLVPGALLGVLFPAIAASFEQDRAATAVLFDRTIRVILLTMFPPVLILIGFAHEGLRLWLGEDFALRGAPIVRWLAAGVLVNSVGHVAFAAVQGTGRPDLTAKLHAAELPAYVAVLLLMIHLFGLTGVAIAWTARVGVDTAALLWISSRRLPEVRLHLGYSGRVFAFLLALLVPAAVIASLGARAAFTSITLVVFAAVSWRRLLGPAERQAILALAWPRGPS